MEENTRNTRIKKEKKKLVHWVWFFSYFWFKMG